MLLCEVLIPGPPVPWMRARSTASGRRFTAPKDKGHRDVIALCAARAMAGRAPVDDDVRVDVAFFLPLPKRILRDDRERALCTGALRPRAGDVDNFAKACLDAVQGLVFVDDKQVVDLFARKFYGAEPRTEMRVHVLADVGHHGAS